MFISAHQWFKTSSSKLPIFVPFSVVGGSNDFVYLSPLVTSYPLLATRHGGCAAYLSPPVTSYLLAATAAPPPQQGHSRSEWAMYFHNPVQAGL